MTMQGLPALTSRNRLVVYGAAGLLAWIAFNRWRREKNKFDLSGKVVLITGGSRGLGLVLARMLAARGARIAICGRGPETLEHARQDLALIGPHVLALQADVSDTEQVDRMIRDVITHYGRLDVLINNAGTIQVGPQESLSLQDYEHAMRINFWGPLYTMLSCIPHFKTQRAGRIVNITSIGGKVAVPHLLPYSASKFALVGLSEGLHTELKKHNILVTTVVPGLMRTGSPTHITVKGNHEAEYAWFKTAASSGWLALKPETAAGQIIEALEDGKAEITISSSARAVTWLQGVAPGLVNSLLELADKFLPAARPGGEVAKEGWKSETLLSRVLGKRSDAEAVQNNQ